MKFNKCKCDGNFILKAIEFHNQYKKPYFWLQCNKCNILIEKTSEELETDFVYGEE